MSTPRSRSPSTHRLASCGVEHLGIETNPAPLESLAELGPNPGGPMVADHPSVFVQAFLLVDKDVLHGDHVAFHAGNLSDSNHLSRSVGEPRHVDDHVERCSDVVPHAA